LYNSHHDGDWNAFNCYPTSLHIIGYPYAKLADKTLCLQVLDYDRFSRDDPIGEVFIPLRDVNIAAGVTLWQTLQPCNGEAVSIGIQF